MQGQFSDFLREGGLWLPIGMMIVMLVMALLVCGRGARRFCGPGACRGRGDASREDPLEILGRRYAKGEITKEEFERIGRDIRRDPRD